MNVLFEDRATGRKTMRALLVLVLLLLPASRAVAAEDTAPKQDAALKAALDETLDAASRAIERHGIADSAMVEIQGALARLAAQPALTDPASRTRLHATHGAAGANAVVLASRGDEGLTVYLARFQVGHATPVHDHESWGVLHVLEGRDHYIHWDADHDPADSSHSEVKPVMGTFLTPGSSVYWFPPPHDIHTQEAIGSTVWELVLAGRNFLSPGVLARRHAYDPKTGGTSPFPTR
jgi:predicted metal-dependent enzyme (double-stranded beta helix superfamily)